MPSCTLCARVAVAAVVFELCCRVGLAPSWEECPPVNAAAFPGGARHGHVMWSTRGVGAAGPDGTAEHNWLFGGWGSNSLGDTRLGGQEDGVGRLNDVWRTDGSTWEMVGGSGTLNTEALYDYDDPAIIDVLVDEYCTTAATIHLHTTQWTHEVSCS